MAIHKISDNVYSIGVMDPSLRVFDTIMESKYGTSYNSYLITGEKNVLVETVHENFFNEYLYNIECLIDIKDIDYIVINHTELDHSGSLSELLDINPDITVVCTSVAKKFLSSILNRDFKCQTVKNDDTLEIGKGLDIRFIVAPFLHWPDTMMSYLESEKVLFSCDFLGAHFCEPTMTDKDVLYREEYLSEFKYYYNCILDPFKSYVFAAANKLSDMDISVVCPSHGPVIQKEVKARIQDYKDWSRPISNKFKRVLVLYASAYGCSKKLAEQAMLTLKENDKIHTKIFDVATTPVCSVLEEIGRSDAIIISSCTINKDVPKVIWDVLSSIDAINSKNKYAGVMGSYGWSGEAVNIIKERLLSLHFKVIGDGLKVVFKPTDEDLSKVSDYTLEIASNL